MATVLLENGAMGSVVNSVLSPRQRTHLRFDFQQATVEVDSLYGTPTPTGATVSLTAPSTRTALARWQRIPDEALSMHAGQVADLLIAWKRTGGLPPAVLGQGGRWSSSPACTRLP